MRTESFAVAAFIGAAAIGVWAQAPAQSPAVTNGAWTRPFPALRIVGNLYYVGNARIVSSSPT
jgi:hypothetical protein